MTLGASRKVTGVLAVHNEERFVGPCLASMAPVCDQLLVVHDGPCRDRSVDIARGFTPDVEVAEFRGAPETNLIRLMRRAAHDWILRVDCDETLSPALQAALIAFKAAPPEDVTHVLAIWRSVHTPADESPARPKEIPQRVTLVRRSHSRWVGIPHDSLRVDGRALALRECVYHHAPHQQYTLRELIERKLRPFSKRDAAIRLKYPIQTIGYDDARSVDEVLRRVDQWRHEVPLLVGGALSLRSFLIAARHALRTSGTWSELRANARWPIGHGAYQLFLAYELDRLRREGYRAHLAPRE